MPEECRFSEGVACFVCGHQWVSKNILLNDVELLKFLVGNVYFYHLITTIFGQNQKVYNNDNDRISKKSKYSILLKEI